MKVPLGGLVDLMYRKFNILVADKNQIVCDVLRRELTAEGYLVSSSGDLDQILLQIEGDNSPDLLVVDFEIPGLDSAVLVEKAQKRNPPLPVIIHTFLTAESQRDEQSGTKTYIEESRNIEHLKSAVADMLKRFNPEAGGEKR